MARWLAKKANTGDLDTFHTSSEFDGDHIEPYELDPDTNREEFDEVLAEWRALHAEVFVTLEELQLALARPGVAEAIAPRMVLLGRAGGLSAWLELFEVLHEKVSSAARAHRMVRIVRCSALAV